MGLHFHLAYDFRSLEMKTEQSRKMYSMQSPFKEWTKDKYTHLPIPPAFTLYFIVQFLKLEPNLSVLLLLFRSQPLCLLLFCSPAPLTSCCSFKGHTRRGDGQTADAHSLRTKTINHEDVSESQERRKKEEKWSRRHPCRCLTIWPGSPLG